MLCIESRMVNIWKLTTLTNLGVAFLISNLNYNPHDIMISLFIRTHLVVQESVVLSECCILENVIIWPPMLIYYQGFKENDLILMSNIMW
jgi:hypothetical protein